MTSLSPAFQNLVKTALKNKTLFYMGATHESEVILEEVDRIFSCCKLEGKGLYISFDLYVTEEIFV